MDSSDEEAASVAMGRDSTPPGAGIKRGAVTPPSGSMAPKAQAGSPSQPSPTAEPVVSLRQRQKMPSTTRAPSRTVVDPSIFSPQEILVTSGSNAEFVRNVISWFSGEPAMQAVDEALAAENCEDLRIAAHTIKGSLGYLYAHRAVEAAKALEQLACTVDQTGEWDDERRSQLSAARAALRAQVDRVEANRLIYLAGFEADRA